MGTGVFIFLLQELRGGEFMNITREQLIKRLADKSGFWQKDIRTLLKCIDEDILELFNEVDDDEDISIQLLDGIRIGCKLVPERERVDPRSREMITCKATVKPFAKFTLGFRGAIQDQYDEKTKK